MAPFTTNNVWRASVHVITLLMQSHSLLASQNECMKNDREVCMYDCSTSELQMFNCSEYMNNSYTPPESHPFCCPGYFKTESGRCQKCNDVEFMPRLNNCCSCLLCKECDAVKENTVNETCTREKNTVCRIETNPTPSPGHPCPMDGLSTTTGPQETQTTGTKYSTISYDDAEEVKSNSNLATGFYVVLPCLMILLVIIFAFCLYVMWLGKSGDEVDSRENYRNVTWAEALTPLGQKMRQTVPCIDRVGAQAEGNGGRAGGGAGAGGGDGGGAVAQNGAGAGGGGAGAGAGDGGDGGGAVAQNGAGAGGGGAGAQNGAGDGAGGGDGGAGGGAGAKNGAGAGGGDGGDKLKCKQDPTETDSLLGKEDHEETKL